VRRLAHLSDLHFGREDPALVRALIDDLRRLRPDLTVVSGDLTQRARRAEFHAAAEFLEALPGPRLVVAGNHDIPLYDVTRRVLDPLGRFVRYVCRDLDPFFADGEVAVLGLNTARPSRWKDGRLSLRQIETIRDRFAAQPPGVFKAIVTHHPFVPEPGDPSPPRLERAGEALAAGESQGVELFLAGHLHQGYLADLREHHAALKRSILVAQAGTAVSRRRRGEPNAYNMVTVANTEVTFDVRAWDGAAFKSTAAVTYARDNGEWRRKEKAPASPICEAGA
jgi:3',5'-cyclic AMP phosphodiesterase CpdA